MCMSSADPKPNKHYTVGYKVFTMTKEGQLLSPIQSNGTSIPTSTWLDEKQFRPQPYKNSYEYGAARVLNLVGWCYLPNLKTARLFLGWAKAGNDSKHCIRKVTVRNTIQTGIWEDGKWPVCTAQFIYVHPEEVS